MNPLRGKEAMPERKLLLFWVLGALAIALGTWITTNVEPVLGATPLSVALAVVIGLILILLGGLAWIAVAVSVAHHR